MHFFKPKAVKILDTIAVIDRFKPTKLWQLIWKPSENIDRNRAKLSEQLFSKVCTLHVCLGGLILSFTNLYRRKEESASQSCLETLQKIEAERLLSFESLDLFDLYSGLRTQIVVVYCWKSLNLLSKWLNLLSMFSIYTASWLKNLFRHFT